MKTIHKAMLLELLGGLFGWAWMISGAIMLYFLVAAIFFSGSWKTFFIFLGISFVCKCMAQGFNHHKAAAMLKHRFETEVMSKD